MAVASTQQVIFSILDSFLPWTNRAGSELPTCAGWEGNLGHGGWEHGSFSPVFPNNHSSLGRWGIRDLGTRYKVSNGRVAWLGSRQDPAPASVFLATCCLMLKHSS